jgi:hypothetical protein
MNSSHGLKLASLCVISPLYYPDFQDIHEPIS